MSDRMRKILRVVADGLACSAKAAAFREGMPWDPPTLRPPAAATAAHITPAYCGAGAEAAVEAPLRRIHR
jgi:hypothetical protein